MKEVAIYTTPTCTYCQQAKTFFRENGIEYAEYDVSADMDKRQEMVDKSGQMGVPVITIGGEMVVGFDQEKVKEMLEVGAEPSGSTGESQTTDSGEGSEA